MFGLVRIRDDRGVVRPLYEEPWSFKGRDKVASQAFREGMEFQHGRKLGRQDVAWLLLAAMGPSVGALVVLPWVKRATSSVAIGLVALFAFAVMCMLAAGMMNVYAARLRVRAALLRSERCASCGYGMRELQVEEDGCVVCAECGGSWRSGAVNE